MERYLIFILVICWSFLSAQASYNSDYTPIPTYTDQEIEERLAKMENAVIKPYFDNIVKSYVKTYTVLRRDRTEAMLGRSVMYFPIYEKILTEKRMPQDLKYLSVLESALNPLAVSRSGARGLWQFMPATGKEQGLSINSLVDERSDPHKSTKAAMDFLSKLYHKYDDWKLALAAYNGGPGRVNRAIKRGRSNNFHRIKKYLPRETRNYVSAFVAASYILNYFQYHNLYPLYPAYDLRYTSTVKIYEPISFSKLSEVTGIPVGVIKTLNPAYKKQLIPASHRGNYLILPDHTMASFLNYLGRPDAQYYANVASARIEVHKEPQPIIYSGLGSIKDKIDDYFKTTYVVKEGETLDKLASSFECSKQDLMAWNTLSSMLLSNKQDLTIYIAKSKLKRLSAFSGIEKMSLSPVVLEDRASKIPVILKYPVQNVSKSRFGKIRSKFTRKQNKTIFYQIRRRETMLDIANKFPGVSVQDILEQNNITNNDILTPGTLLKIKVGNF